MRRARAGIALLAALVSAASCTYEGDAPRLGTADVHLTLLHTADWHSRLYPYDFVVGQVDENLGLVQGNAPFGGAARMSYLLGRERARAARVLHLDSGDCFQGAPIFNYFGGEAETRALSASGLDAMVIGNHEFDAGGANFAKQMFAWADFPVLAANYQWDPTSLADTSRPQLGRVSQPYTVFDVDGLKVGVIGMGNLSSLTSVFDQPNRLGIIPIETVQAAQFYIDLLRPQVDVVVMLTHLGLHADESMVERTSGIDVVLGGHLHIVLNPPKIVRDCARTDADGRHFIEFPGSDSAGAPIRRYCRQRDVVLTHSGAFMKYLGRLDVVVTRDAERVQPERPAEADDWPETVFDPSLDGYEVLTHHYDLFPLDATVPEDPRVAEMLVPYEQAIANLTDLDLLVGYAPFSIRRFGPTGGDSPLGNLVAEAMWLRLGIQTDFALTNTTGIRTDLVPGPIRAEEMFNVFPFDNTVTKMFLSGREVRELFDFVARRSAQRGCNSQSQVAGVRAIIECGGCERTGGEPCASRVAIGRTDLPCERDADCGEGLCDRRHDQTPEQWRCLLPIVDDASYELATNNYIAQGGSGFRVLQRNTTQIDTRLQQRDVLVDFIRQGPPCGADPETGVLPACSSDADCGSGTVCGCPARAGWDGDAAMCVDGGGCAEGLGRCVLARCVGDVAYVVGLRRCEGVVDATDRAACECEVRSRANEQCKFLACIDDRLGAASDGRIDMRAF